MLTCGFGGTNVKSWYIFFVLENKLKTKKKRISFFFFKLNCFSIILRWSFDWFMMVIVHIDCINRLYLNIIQKLGTTDRRRFGNMITTKQKQNKNNKYFQLLICCGRVLSYSTAYDFLSISLSFFFFFFLNFLVSICSAIYKYM